ncbi:MAG: 50S ribosomal protein L4 [Candidatus Hadarchaeales archaeon]
MVGIYSLDGKLAGEIQLPPVFSTEIRPDLIRRAFLSEVSRTFQPKGVDPMAGKRTSAETWGKGFGVARVRRVKGSRYPAAGRGAFAPFTVGGRRTHPPKPEKRVVEKINKKEYLLALKSAIASTSNKDLVLARGHRFKSSELPLVVVREFEGLKKTSEVKSVLQRLGVWSDVERAKKGTKIRAGKGKRRGRRYREPRGPLIVVAEDRGIRLGARNLPGVEVVEVKELNVEKLAPGGVPGRLTIWSEPAIQALEALK